MKNKSSSTKGREIRLSFSLAAIVYLLLGILLLVAPNTSRRLLCMLVGVGVLVYGAFNILSYVLDKGSSAYTLELLIGICAAAFGVFALLNPDFLVSFLFIVLGLIVMVGSVSGFKRALNLRAFGFPYWWASLLSAIITFAVALSIVIAPTLYGNMALMVIGIILIVESVSDLLSIHRLTKMMKDVEIR
ncbi:MAG: DUF308 domain-containing protein [Clostridia bacterium]|nr:DUF308 domain-containing protein [Clostridia bacterium]